MPLHIYTLIRVQLSTIKIYFYKTKFTKNKSQDIASPKMKKGRDNGPSPFSWVFI
jgi:hypothetical protein